MICFSPSYAMQFMKWPQLIFQFNLLLYQNRLVLHRSLMIIPSILVEFHGKAMGDCAGFLKGIQGSHASFNVPH